MFANKQANGYIKKKRK